MTYPEMIEEAMALRPQLLRRAFELSGSLDAEDLVGDVYLRLVERPPRDVTPTKLKHWLRTVLVRRSVDLYRQRTSSGGEGDTISLEAMPGAG